MKRTIVHAALVGSLAFAGLGAAFPAAAANGSSPAPEVKKVEASFSDEEVKIMASSSGRTVPQQKALLKQQVDQNNTYAGLVESGLAYDGAFFNAENKLVVQAPAGSKAAKAAAEKGIEVRDADFGQTELNKIADELAKLAADDASIASISPQIEDDTVVVTTAGKVADSDVLKKAEKYGKAVTVKQGQRNELQAAVKGGDKVDLGGGYCSAGFPGTTADGKHVMVWAGHCIENKTSFSVNGQRIGTEGKTAFKSYDGQPDRDFGYVVLSEGAEISTDVNTYGSNVGITNAAQGAWEAPIGTEMCRTGATSGVTCGKVTSYNNSVNYTDEYGRDVAQVSGLGASTVCTAAGDSGGAYTAANQAVGMTSGGPAGQKCGFNGGYVQGKSSYFQPVTDALENYQLQYGHK